ncbi:hypothetical protein OF83DRAFT_1115208 [Amylostereum chailletii]|nr:hypothetical protein OF83DRAFT_1115208 [Amylostereum chailletii]
MRMASRSLCTRSKSPSRQCIPKSIYGILLSRRSFAPDASRSRLRTNRVLPIL